MSITKDIPLVQLITNTQYDFINVPIFQRPYSWDKIQIDQYLLDLKDAMNHQSKHFFGLVVFVAASSKRQIDLIDGQQRITTAMITLAVIRDYLNDLIHNGIKLSEDDLDELRDEVRRLNDILMSNDKCRLFTSNESKFEKDFLEIIQKPLKKSNGEIKKQYDVQPKGKKNAFEIKKQFLIDLGDKRTTKSKSAFKNYVEIYNHIFIEIKSYTPQKKVDILYNYSNTILKNFTVIDFFVENEETAFEYFEVLNDRGLEISALDLVKNSCLKKTMTHSDRNEIFSHWKEIFSTTLESRHNLLLFIRYAYMSTEGHVTKSQVYKSYSDLLSKKDVSELREYLKNDLLIQAKAYKCIVDEDSDLLPQYHNIICLLKSTKTVQWYSIAMAVLVPIVRRKKISTATRHEIISLLESIHQIMLAINFTSTVANVIEKQFPKIATTIKYSLTEDAFLKSLKTASREINKIKNENNLTVARVKNEIKNNECDLFEDNNKLALMVILYLKYIHFNNNNDTKIYLGSLEHLFPQKPKENEWPIINNMSSEDLRKITFSLGNFFHTNTTFNKELSNKSFQEKKKEYKRNKMLDLLKVQSNLHYLKVTKWDLKTVQARTAEILKLL